MSDEDYYYKTSKPEKSPQKAFEENASKYHWQTRSQYDWDRIGPARRVLDCLSENYDCSGSLLTTITLGFMGKNHDTFGNLKQELQAIERLTVKKEISMPEAALLVKKVLEDKQYAPKPGSDTQTTATYGASMRKATHMFKYEYGQDIALAEKLVGWKKKEIQGQGGTVASEIKRVGSTEFPKERGTTYNHSDSRFYHNNQLTQYNSDIDKLARNMLEENKSTATVQKIADRRAQCLGFKDLGNFQEAYFRTKDKISEASSSASSSSMSSSSSSPGMMSSSSGS